MDLPTNFLSAALIVSSLATAACGGGGSAGSTGIPHSDVHSAAEGRVSPGGTKLNSGASGGGSLPKGPAVALSGDTSRPNNSTFVQGEPVTLTFTVIGGATTVNVAIVDENGKGVVSASLPVTNGVATYSAPSAKLGYYRVNASLTDGTTNVRLGTRPAGFITYAVVPDPATRVNYGDTLSRFGMQGGFSPAQGAVIPYLGIRYVIGTPNWSQLEPKGAGQLASEQAQGQRPANETAWAAVNYNGVPWQTFKIAQLASTGVPPWAGPIAGTGGTQCSGMGQLNAAGVAGLPKFATALATEVPKDYPGQTHYFYQVTWEPEAPWCYGGNGVQLKQYYKLVYAPLHAADPSAQVMGPTLFHRGDEAQLASLYAAGFGRVIDAFSIHPYASWPAETSDLVTHLRAEMAEVRAAAHKTIPFFGTEHGLTSGSIGELNQALGNVREEIMLIGEGFIHDIAFYIADFWVNSPTEPNNTYGYYWNLDPKVIYGTDKVGPKIVAPAWAAMTYLLDGSTTSGPLSNLSGTQMGYRFTRNGSTILALWDYQADSSTLNLPVPNESIQICDWMGNCSTTTSSGGSLDLTLGASPIYVIGQRIGRR